MSGISLKNVTKIYPNGFTALEDLTLDVNDKEFIVLVGSSGCGKSTILKIIAGLEGVSKGQVIIGDKNVNNVSPKDRNISMVFQDYALYPHLSVYDNMAFSLKLKKYKKAEINEKIEAVSKKLKIDDILNKKPATLSGGQKQRVALGRAIIREPKVFLFDEPLSNIDAKLRMQTRIELIKLHKQLQTTFIYVTHDQTEAMTMADRIVVMQNGKIQQIDTPENLYNNPDNLFTASFIGTPQMNFIDGQLSTQDKNDILNIDINGQTITNLISKNNTNEEITDRQVILGIRSEKVCIKDDILDMNVDDKIIIKNCDVEAIELLGSEKLIYFNCGETNIITKVDASQNIAKNKNYDIYFNIKDIHIFDKQTERKIIL
ncbi:sn-glycerol-3-phosphate ABC transporter ATP-binding protein UgpC [Sedimentibacter sp. zth1]|uniref:ABC transporter ATP-binding protein n=1 Tax=Sedimentibacter sp. zth1 TaxID=2816908 RepID=UPI001A90FA5B|nr:sn-glycerol-3-phosphate ABC transporter ATP-binding protein UgpC [Sedimentibacter sp. zth1]QSX05882.1 sn-glycerol-3-phosphate ABC transporter ATP-binding protein UgpC [Sedimentibacter sp. zth1]